MTQFGSLQNHIAGNSNTVTAPEVGMGCTRIYWTDRSPATVIAVSVTGKTLKVQSDKSVRTDANGMSECQRYEFSPDPEGTIEEVKLRSRRGKKVWIGVESGATYVIGRRSQYHDYSF